MKKLSSLKLSSIVFGIFILLPMFSILSRVIYIQSNPNAKDSYYGETINEKQINVTMNVKSNNTYYMNITSDLYVTSYTSNGYINKRFNVTNVYKNGVLQNNIDNISFYMTSNGYEVITYNGLTQNGDWYVVRDNLQVSFLLISISNRVESPRYQYEDIKNLFYTYEYNDYSYLDNVFDYSLHTFLEDDNNYSINFFNFFDNTFLSQSGNNMLYLNFLNWYMNYGLLVSCGYILFFILYFFINVIRKLVLSFTNKIDGGF